MKIQPIVEGDGEVTAIPELLRRFCHAAQSYALGVNPPIRRKRSDLVTEMGIRKAVRLALKRPHCAAILIIFDSDDDCPKDVAPRVQSWAASEATAVPCFVVMPVCEYEAWFLATVESLRGVRGILVDAISDTAPESRRGAAEEVRKRMAPNRRYSKPVDQPALTARFDMAVAYQRCRSFRRMVRVFGQIAQCAGIGIDPWPPADWSAP
jgi:hypothetical protein